MVLDGVGVSWSGLAGVLETSWTSLRGILGRLGRFLGRLGRFLGHLGGGPGHKTWAGTVMERALQKLARDGSHGTVRSGVPWSSERVT